MSNHEDSWERLDTEFDHCLLDMKPYVLKHPDKKGRQYCAIWIKKLCDPGACGSGLLGRKNRNVYARLLLQMLKRGALDRPFTHKPEPGTLKTLPTYMSIYFDEPVSIKNHTNLPDWVTGELGAFDDDSWNTHLENSTRTPQHRRRLYDDKSRSHSQPVTSSPLKRPVENHAGIVDVSSADSDLEARLNSWNLGILKSSFGANSSFAEDHIPPVALNNEAELKMKVLEAKHQEEKLKMQQRHDGDVEKILARKNSEIEELKSTYLAKQKQSEETIRKLERKVQSVLQESQVIVESKEKQIAELKKMADQSSDSLKNEWEKKLHAAVTEMEQEKFELQKKHTMNIQELLEETNLRLAKMEAEYSARAQSTELTVRELERRVKQQSVEVEKGNTLRQKVTQEKAQLEIHIAAISAELQEANRRTVNLQKEKEDQKQLYEQNIDKLHTKYETDISHLQQEHILSAAKASELIGELEKTVGQLRLQLQDSENLRGKQLRDQEMKLQMEKDELEIQWEKKALATHSEAEKERAEVKRKIGQLEDSLRDTERELERTRESQRQQKQQADVALEQFKKQVEVSSEKAYAEMKLQMEKVEDDLVRSKSLRENQAKEFSQQLDSLRLKYEQQMAELRMQHEQERTRLQQAHIAEKDGMVQERQREVVSLERQARATLQQHQQLTQEWRKRDAQVISDLETQVTSLREELQISNFEHKQQLAEMTSQLEEDKQKSSVEKEEALEQLRSVMERSHKDLERRLQREHDAALEQANSRLKQIEKDYSQKLTKSAQLIAELQTCVCDSKEEAVRLQKAMERQLEEAHARWDEQRKTLHHHADQSNKALQEKVESLQMQLHSSEKKLLSKELETEEKVTAVRQEYEEKIKGLMPFELRQELEDTITSLKSQVNFLQKRATLLQEDLDACRSRR
ncbi:centrosomal protein of 112 kDa isoform X2 [Boleophthalmus pectinirostris]|uniref:centrosomal protein of 112 kDa isoform X2 n=1 Tax=Boleophthalmus pectinirostris TaxID=150288 RepID=UPI00242DBB79|nr:centrosomal protein of 112 kDa isoform X2 [Boleophthalmus pectinirostris]